MPNAQSSSVSSLVVSSDFVLEVAEEASLCLLLLTVLIDNPFLIFEELSVLDKSLVNIGLATDSSSALGLSLETNVSLHANISMDVSGSLRLNVSGSLRVNMTSSM